MRSHACYRPCSCDPSTFKTCTFNFRVHEGTLASADCKNCSTVPKDCKRPNCIYGDGHQTPFLAINGMFPGPEIKVCHGDKVVVAVKNELTEETTMHWHGIRQKKTPWMDGVPYVTQYPLQPGMTQIYEFETESPGSFFYHSHIHMQRAFGMTGALIVGSCENTTLECPEHTVLIHDLAYDFNWAHPKNVFVNGKGRMAESDISESNKTLHLYMNYRFLTGKCYILNVIVTNYADYLMEFSIDNHTMTVLESDGECVSNVPVQSLLLDSGERFKVRVDADQENGWYWMRLRSYLQGNIIQAAIIRYNDRGGHLNSLVWDYTLDGPQFNSVWLGRMGDVKDIPINEAHACGKQDVCSDSITYYLNLNVTASEQPLPFDFSINDIFNKPLTNLSLLHVQGMLDESKLFCNKDTLRAEGRNCTYPNRCECAHVISIELMDCVEFFFINNNNDGHSIHLHGYNFFVIGQGILTKEELINVSVLSYIQDFMFKFQLDEVDKKTPMPRNVYDPLLKDTFMVPSKGYGIIRFAADNPGYWLVHCHMEAHSDLGMSFVMKVGEYKDILDPPEVDL